MPLYVGGQRIAKLYKGATPIARAYRGATLVFSSGPKVAFVDSQGSGSDLTEYEFADLALGAANAKRHLLACVLGGGSGARTVSELSIAGQATTGLVTVNDTSLQDLHMRITSAFVPEGLTGSGVVTFSGAHLRCGISLHRLVGWNPSPFDTDSKGGVPNENVSRTVTLDVPAGGIVIAAAHKNDANDPLDWTNAIEEVSQTVEGVVRLVVARAGPFAEAQEGYQITANTCRLLLAASFAPA